MPLRHGQRGLVRSVRQRRVRAVVQQRADHVRVVRGHRQQDRSPLVVVEAVGRDLALQQSLGLGEISQCHGLEEIALVVARVSETRTAGDKVVNHEVVAVAHGVVQCSMAEAVSGVDLGTIALQQGLHGVNVTLRCGEMERVAVVVVALVGVVPVRE